jgi:UDPglucose 6-dehydrogenase
MQKIGIIGLGFVGNAVREGLKNHFDVRCFDIDSSKGSNEMSLYTLVENVNETFLCLPTPMYPDGQCDLSYILKALGEINQLVAVQNKKDFIVIIKSTIPPGTTVQLNEMYNNIHIAFNPEFLTEANAVDDYKNQNRIVIGAARPYSTRVKRIFEKAFPKIPIIKTNSTIAETIKYVTNIFLASKVAFANEMYQMCEALDIDYDKVIEYARYDDRLGNTHWAVPGPDGDFGFGGHCFPKDIAALQYTMKKLNVDSTIIDSVIKKNELVRTDRDWERQVGRAVSKIS